MSDFETQLRERLEDSTSGVAGTDALYDRAESRYHTHTRRRMVAGGIVTAVVVALGAVLGSSLLDQRPEPPIVRQPEPSQTASPGPDALPGLPPLLIANEVLLDELGVADDDPIRRWPATLRAFPAAEHGTLVLVGEGDGCRSDCGREVVLIGPSGHTREVYSLRGGATSVDLHGYHESEPGWAMVSSVDAGRTHAATVMVEHGEDVIVAEYPATSRIHAMGVATDPSNPGDFLPIVVTALSSSGALTLDPVSGPDGAPASLPWQPFETCPDCRVRVAVAGGSRLAYVVEDGGGLTRVHVEDPFSGSVEAVAGLVPNGGLTDPRVELRRNDVIVNATEGRWHLDVTSGTVTSLDPLGPGFVTLGPADDDVDEPAPPGAAFGTWQDAPPPPLAPNGQAWELAGPVLVQDTVYVLASWTQRDGDAPWPTGVGLLRYDPSVASWTTLATPPGSGELYAADGILVLLGAATGETIADRWRTWTYRPLQDRWDEQPDVPLEARTGAGHSVTWTGGELIVWGGLAIDWSDGSDAGEDRARTFNDGAAFEPYNGTWRALADAPLSPRGDHGTVWNGRRLIVFGGGDAGDFEGEFYWSEHLHDAAVYDPAADSWATIQSPGRLGPVIAADWTGTHVITSTLNPFDEDRPFGWWWEPVSGTAEPLPTIAPQNLPNYRDSIDHQWVPDVQRWVLWGGGCGEGCNASFAHGWLYDPATTTWTRLDDPGARTGYGGSAAWIGDRLLIVGGDDGTNQNHGEMRRVTPRFWLPPED